MGRNLVLITVALLLVLHGPTAALAQVGGAPPSPSPQVVAAEEGPKDALGACVVAFRTAAMEARPDLMSAARRCESLDDWLVASAVYPQALDQGGAFDVAATLCADQSRGLMADALCGDLESRQRAAPSPSATEPDPTGPGDAEVVAQAFVDLVVRWNDGFAPIDALWDEEDVARQGEYWRALADHDERFLRELLTITFPPAVAPHVDAYAYATSEMALLEWRLGADPADITLREQVGAVSQADLDTGAALWDALGLPRDS